MSLRFTVNAEVRIINIDTERDYWQSVEVSISQTCQEDEEMILTIEPGYLNVDKYRIPTPIEVKLKLEPSDYQTLRKFTQ